MGRHGSKVRFGKDSSLSYFEELSLPHSQLSVHVVNYELKITIPCFVVEDGKIKVLSKDSTSFYIKNSGAYFRVGSIAVFRVNHLGFGAGYSLARDMAEGFENLDNGMVISYIGSSKQCEITSKEEM